MINMNSKMKVTDRNSVCRLCLCHSGSFLDIFLVNDCFGQLVADAIAGLLQIEVTKTDIFPKVICVPCFKKIVEFEDFKKKCLQSKDKFSQDFVNSEKDDVCEETFGETTAVRDKLENLLDPHGYAKSSTSAGDAVVSSGIDSSHYLKQVSNRKETELTGLNLNRAILTTPQNARIEEETELRCLLIKEEVHSPEEYPVISIGNDDIKNEQLLPEELLPLVENERNEDFMDYEKEKMGLELLPDVDSEIKYEFRSEELEVLSCIDEILGCDKSLESDQKLTLSSDKFLSDDVLCQEKNNNLDLQSYQDLSPDINLSVEQIPENCSIPASCDADDKYPFGCKKCGKSYKNKTALKLHMRIHFKDSPFSCRICDDRFASREEANKHQKTHIRKKEHVCEKCGGKFASELQLDTHRSKHIKIRSYTCNVCKERFTNRAEFARHRRTHKLACETCGKLFAFQFQLNKHLISHTDNRPFGCDVCSKGFKTIKCLREHLRIHRDEKPFGCKLCDKSFCQSGNLGLHMAMHMRDKQFKCDLCGKSYSRKTRLLCHQINEHQM